jgi:hypothetical protein
MAARSYLQHALDRARRARPAPLPADFAAGVVEHLFRRPSAAGWFRPADAFAMAAAVVLTAVAISLSIRPSDAGPPPLPEFGGSPILFVAP